MAALPSQSSVFLSTYQIEDDALDNEGSRKLFWQCFFPPSSSHPANLNKIIQH